MKLHLSIFYCASALALATPVGAQSSLSADTTAARADYRKAVAEMDKGNWEAARAILADLFKRSPTFDVAASLGEAETKLDRYPDAARHFAFALKNVPPKERADTSVRIRAGLSEVTAKVATVRLAVNQPEAQISVDGEGSGAYPGVSEVYLSPGKHVIEARAGDAFAKQEVDVAAGKTFSISLELVAPPGSGLPPSSSAGIAVAPIPPRTPPEADGSDTTWTPVLVTGGLALVAVGIGTGFALDASAAQSDTKEKLEQAQAVHGPINPCAPGRGEGSGYCDDLASLKSRRDSSRTASTVSFVLGGVFAAGAAGSYFLWASGPDRAASSAKLSAAVVDGGTRLVFEGRF